MQILGFAIFGSIFTIVLFTVFTGLIWAALSDGRVEREFRARSGRGGTLR